MGPHVPLQFVGVPAGVAAQAALERALAGVGANVAFQFANLEAKSRTDVSTAGLTARRSQAKSLRQPIFTLPLTPRACWDAIFTQPLSPARSAPPANLIPRHLFLHLAWPSLVLCSPDSYEPPQHLKAR